MKKALVFIFAIALILSCAMPVFATDVYFVYVNDSANLLNDSEYVNIDRLCYNASVEYGIDIAILTVTSTEGKSISRFADDYYYNSGYSLNGLILVINMGERDVYISTSGEAISIFNDAYLDRMIRNITSDLSYGNYFDAFSMFVDDATSRISRYDSGDVDVYSNSNAGAIIFAVIIGIVIALIIVMSHVKKLKPVAKKKNAANYIIGDSARITQSRDMFLYSNIVKTPKPKQLSSGGSSTHRSSSGHVHGGRGGKF